jgi:ubiquinone/menaquinone biosynthesis C-methylase UbiE
MSNPTDPRREHPSTYFVQDRSNLDEMTRLHIQDTMLNKGMGGTLPEQPDPTIFRRVLDVGCGTGDWLIEAAKTYPNLSSLVGVDISGKMLDYARTQAEEQGVGSRIEFRTMDALRMLEFPVRSFDLVNHRLGMSWLRKREWPKLLQEYQRVSKPGGVIRITEAEMGGQSHSPALTRLSVLSLEVLHQAGNFYTRTPDGLTHHLPTLMSQHGVQNVQTRAHHLEFHAGSLECQSFYQDMQYLYRIALPYMRKWTHIPDDYEEIYQQMLTELQQPDFVGTWNLLTVWGTVPQKRRVESTRD